MPSTTTRTRRQGRQALERRLQAIGRLVADGRLAEAGRELAPLLSRRHPPAGAWYLGTLLAMAQGEILLALQRIEEALRIEPRNRDYLVKQAEVLVAGERYQEAFDRLRAAAAALPDEPRLLAAMGEVCRLAGNPEAGVRFLQKAMHLAPRDPDILMNLGLVMADLGHPDTALRCFEQADRLSPGRPAVLLGWTTTLRSLGRIPEAVAVARRGIAADPGCGPLQYALAQMEPPRDTGDPRFAAMKAVLRQGRTHPMDSSLLHFALGEMYRRLDRPAEAMEHYTEGNRWRALYLGRDFSLDETVARFAALRRTFDHEFFAHRRDWGQSTELPVFVVGMPRSGTTLVESILGRHPDVHPAGELRLVGRTERELLLASGTGDPAVAAPAWDRDTVAAAARRCLERYRALAPDAGRIVDKMPHNFEKLWLIALLFPGARVIDARRSPLDTCLSCYTTPFSEPHGYRNDLAVLGRYYRAYRELMAHWRQVLPLRFLEVQYESVTADQVEESRRLVAFLDLPWDDRCLDFQHATAAVRTASAAQVRRGMYRSSVGRWRPYAAWLAPLREGLGPELTAEAERLG